MNPVCPECQQGKHQNCDATAWDDMNDRLVQCGCWVVDHNLSD